MDKFDVCIAGAGVVGLAIAYQLSKSARYANASIVLLEREPSFGQITSSRNSEVIHAGICYPELSQKVFHCVRGRKMLFEYCHENILNWETDRMRYNMFTYSAKVQEFAK